MKNKTMRRKRKLSSLRPCMMSYPRMKKRRNLSILNMIISKNRLRLWTRNP
jgi:hypothetical protein